MAILVAIAIATGTVLIAPYDASSTATPYMKMNWWVVLVGWSAAAFVAWTHWHPVGW